MNLPVSAISDMLEHLLCQLTTLSIKTGFSSLYSVNKRSLKKSSNILNLKKDRNRKCTEK